PAEPDSGPGEGQQVGYLRYCAAAGGGAGAAAAGEVDEECGFADDGWVEFEGEVGGAVGGSFGEGG
ncbi:hypothetical protein V490_01465, partial [Pseudogymnoascus sp. VKM F-3557]